MSVLFKEQILPIKISDFDYNDYITPHALLEYFQQIAVNHTFDMNIGPYEVDKLNFHFVITKSRYTLFKTPGIHDGGIKLTTYPKKPGRLYFDRDYEIKDVKTDELIGIATSRWLLVDNTTSKICRSSSLPYKGEHIENSVYEEDIEKLDFSHLPFEKVFSYKVLISDLDRNMHMNNTRYAKIVLDSFDNLDNFKIKDFTINYLLEIKKDDVIDIYKYQDNNTYYFLGKKDDKICFSVKAII